MANRTIKEAKTVHGTNPQYLVEKIVRTRIYDSKFWKEECFGLTAELMVDKAIELKFIGGAYGGNTKPTPFISLLLKMLQIQPEKDIIIEFIRQEHSKYARALGAIYLRLTGTAVQIYKYLEPLYNDCSKMKRLKIDGNFELVHMDEFVDELLHNERVCNTALPRLPERRLLVEEKKLEEYVSSLDLSLTEVMEGKEDNESNKNQELEKVKENDKELDDVDEKTKKIKISQYGKEEETSKKSHESYRETSSRRRCRKSRSPERSSSRHSYHHSRHRMPQLEYERERRHHRHRRRHSSKTSDEDSDYDGGGRYSRKDKSSKRHHRK
ncbi:hypothetical protein SNEBB_007130 [Seison nebaliae]|nr:hypothetical protein SNEBB_007130 [Seison nebaliae]